MQILQFLSLSCFCSGNVGLPVPPPLHHTDWRWMFLWFACQRHLFISFFFELDIRQESEVLRGRTKFPHRVVWDQQYSVHLHRQRFGLGVCSFLFCSLETSPADIGNLNHLPELLFRMSDLCCRPSRLCNLSLPLSSHCTPPHHVPKTLV